MKAKKIFLAILSVMMAFCCAGLVACKDNNKPKPNPGGKDDVFDTSAYGNYYYLTTEDEYKLTVDASNFNMTRQDLKIENDRASYTGTYTYKDGVVSVTFKDNTTATATYDKDTGILTVKYDNSSLAFVKDVTYTVTFDSNGGSSVESQQVRNGRTATSPVPPVKDGYTFLKWYKDAALTQEYSFGEAITGDITLYAKYRDKASVEYTVGFATGFEDISYSAVTTDKGRLSASDIPVPVKEGYTFIGWWRSDYSDSAKLTSAYEDGYTFNQNETLYAVWNASGSKDIHASVTESKITINNPDSSVVSPYIIEIKDATGKKVAGDIQSATKVVEYDFSALKAGDYVVTVTNGDKTATAYYKNKTLARVSSFEVESGVIIFNEVENAEYYTLTIVCGNKDHNHKDVRLSSNTYDFSTCEMQEDGISFTVKAYADGYLTSTSEVYVYKKNLSEVTGLAYDSAKSELTWNAVANAANYVVTVNGESYVVDGTSYSLRYETGSLKVSVKAEAKGYISSTAALDVTISRLATPTNIKISNNVITWDAVEGATGYVVKMLGRENDVTGTSYTIPANTIGSTKITIVAKAANSANNSVASEEIAIEKNSSSMNPVYNNGKVTWNYLYNVDTYVVKVNDGEEFEVSGKNEADVVLTKEGENVIYVKAKSDKSWQTTDVTAYKITYNTLGGTIVANEYKAKGDTMTLPESSLDGYDFGGWYKTVGGAEANGEKYSDYKFNGTSNITLYVSWNPKTYKVILKLSNDDENPVEVEVKYRREFSLGTAINNDAARVFKGWYSELNGQGISYTDAEGNSASIFTSTKDITLYAGWNIVLKFEAATTGSNAYQVKKGTDIANVSEVTIPEVYNGVKVTQLNATSFADCKNLITVNIPDTITLLATSSLDNASSGTGSAFQGSNKLENVNVYETESADKGNYSSYEGAVYERGMDGSLSLLLVPIGKTGEYHIMEGTSEISSRVMKKSKIETVYVPASVKRVAESAFESASLKTIIFEEGEASDKPSLEIANRAFKKCSSLEKVVLPSHLTEFNVGMFVSCSNLATIEINGTNGKYRSIDGMLCEIDNNNYTLVYVGAAYAGNAKTSNNKGKLVIPGEITKIADYAVAVPQLADSSKDGEEDQYTYSGNKKIYEVVIPYTVERIGKGAFTGCSYIKSIEFNEVPGGTTDLTLEIASEAFANCTSITSVTLPSHLKKLDEYAFSGTTKLTTVNVNTQTGAELVNKAFEDIETGEYYVVKVNIGKNTDIFDINGVFGGYKIASVSVAEGNPYISSIDGVLFNAAGTKLLFYPAGKYGAYVIPEKVTEIAAGVFIGKTNITKITIGKNIEIIGEQAFKDCKLLTEVVFEDGGTAELKINAEAFMGCLSLTGIDIPVRTTKLGARAFAGCSGITSIYIPEKVSEMFDVSDGKKVFNLFDSCSQLVSITVAEGNEHFTAAEGVLYTKENNEASQLVYVPLKKTGAIKVAASVKSVIDRAFYQNNGVTEVTFEKTDDSEFVLGAEVFSGARMLTKVVLPEGLKVINERTFFECSNLAAVTIPYTVQKIDKLAFYNCTKLATVSFEATPEGTEKAKLEIADEDIPDDTSTSTYGVFGGCTSLGEIVFPERTAVIGNKAFGNTKVEMANQSLTRVVIPSTIERIGDYAFGYCSGINEIVMPANSALQDTAAGTGIGRYAFAQIETLTSIIIPESTNTYSIGAKAFYYSGIENVTIPECVKSISGTDTATSSTIYGAFYYAKKLKTVTFAGTSVMTAIEDKAFYGTELLNNITLPAGIQTIGASAFDGAGKASEIPLTVTFTAGESGYALTDIKINAFYGANIKSLTLPEGLKTIGNFAFYNAPIDSVTIPSTVTTIGNGAFGASDFGVGIGELVFAVDQSTGKSQLQTIGERAFSNSRFAEVSFPESIGEILIGTASGESRTAAIFTGNTDLRTAYISTSVKDVTDVFTGCPNMESITVAEDHENYSVYPGEPVLYNKTKTGIIYICGQLKGNVEGEEGTYRIADGTDYIAEKAFAEQNLLKKVIIPTSVKTIGKEAFKNSVNLANVQIIHADGTPSQLESLGTSVFEGCTSLSSINLPSNGLLKVIPEKAFYNCYSLTALTIPEGIETISNMSLSGALVTELTIPASVTTLGTYGGNYTSTPSFSNGINASYQANGTYLSNLTTLTILGDIENIGYGALAYNKNLTTVILSDKLTHLGVGMFAYCDALKTVKVLKENGTVVGEDGKAILPSALTTIENFAFSYSGIEDITIHENVTAIGTGTSSQYQSPFYSGNATSEYSYKLKKVTLLSANATLGNWLFFNCKGLEELVLNDAMTELPSGMLASTSSLRTIRTIDLTKTDDPETAADERISGEDGVGTLPSKLVKTNARTFDTCGLVKLIFGENVTTITSKTGSLANDATFYSCPNLEEVWFLGKDTKIDGSEPFYSAKKVKKVVVNRYSSILAEDMFFLMPLFNTLSLYDPDADESNRIIGKEGEAWIPEGTTVIPETSFDTLDSLTTVIMSNKVEEFGYNAFRNCYNLRTIKTYDENLKITGNDGEVRLPEALATIGGKSIEDSSVTTIIFAGNKLTSMADFMFKNNKQLVTVKYVKYEGDTKVIENGNEVLVGNDGEVNVPEGVTEIRTQTFGGSPIVKVTLPTTITKLGDGTSSAGDGTFYNNTSLKEVVIKSDKITTVCSGIFAGCSSLEKVTIPSNLPEISSYMFYNCFSLKYILDSAAEGEPTAEDYTTAVVPASATKIGAYAFCGTAIKTVKIADKVTSIGDAAFSNCSNMVAFEVSSANTAYKSTNGILLGADGKLLAYPAGLDKDIVLSGVTEIGKAAFANSDVRSIFIPKTVTSIAEEAFKNTTNLRTVTFEEGSELKEIGDLAFAGSSLREITIPASVEKLGTPVSDNGKKVYDPAKLVLNGVFMNCTKLEKVTMLGAPTMMAQGTFAGCVNLTEVVLSDSIIDIPEYTFQNCNKLVTVRTIKDGVVTGNIDEVTLPGGIRSIGSGAFAATAIKKIVLPATLNTLGDSSFNFHKDTSGITFTASTGRNGNYGVFYNCASLESVKFLGTSLDMYDTFLFNGCTSLREVNIPSDLTYIEEGMFYNCTSLQHVVIPENVETIGFYTFHYSGLTSVVIPSSVKNYVSYIVKSKKEALGSVSSGKEPFQFCNYLVRAEVNSTALPNYMFSGDENLASVIMENVITIGTYAFQDCVNLNGVVLNKGLTSLGNFAFKGCESLTSIKLPSKIVKIGSSVFSGCSSLKNVTFEGNVTEIGSSAFEKTTALTSITIPSTVTKINGSAFADSGLTKVVIPKSVTVIGGTNAYDQNNYTDEEFANSSGAFARCLNLTEVVVEAGGAAEIGASTFNGCSKLTTVTLGEGLKGIGSGIFANTAISSITIPKSTTAIGLFAFANCDKLETINVTTGNTVFESVNGVLYFKQSKSPLAETGEKALHTYPAGKKDKEFTVTTADTALGAFSGNDYLEKVTLPAMFQDRYTYCSKPTTTASQTRSMSQYTGYNVATFERCSALKTVIYQGSIGYIGKRMFYNCVSLKTVGVEGSYVEGKVILDGVVFIGESAFNGSGIEDVYVKNESALTYLGYSTTGDSSSSSAAVESNKVKGAFSNCLSLTKAVIDSPIKHLPALLFYNTPALTDLTISSTDYTSIGGSAFEGSGIKSFKIPETVLKLGSSYTTVVRTFKDCVNLTNVELHEGLTIIGAQAFMGCSSLTTLNLPDSITDIGAKALQGTGITEFVAPASIARYHYVGGSSSDAKSAEEYETKYEQNAFFYGMTNLKKVDLSKTSTNRLPNAMLAHSGVTELILPSTLEEIPSFFFADSLIETVELPETVNTIAPYAFMNSKIKNLVLTDVTKYVRNYAFVGSSIETIIIPTITTSTSATARWSYAFKDVKTLKSVVLGEGIEYIPVEAFSGCSALETIEIPAAVTSIEDGAFDGCTSLKNIVIAEGNSVYGTVNGAIYEKATRKIIVYPLGKEVGEFAVPEGYKISENALNGAVLTTITLPVGYEDIGDYALAGVTADAVVLSSNTKSIGEYAFANAKVTSLAIPATVDYIDANAFDGWTADQTITFTITKAEATAKYGTDWLNGCNATIVYKQA